MTIKALLSMNLNLLWEIMIVMINCQQDIASFNLVCNHTRN